MPGKPGKIVAIAWDGREVGNHLEHVVVADSDGSGQRILTTSGVKSIIPVPSRGLKDVDYPSWSPDGSKIAYLTRTYRNSDEYGSAIHVMNADGSGDRELSSSLPYDGSFGDTTPSWSPDGSKIVFARMRNEYVDEIALTYRLWIMDADGGNQRELTQVLDLRRHGLRTVHRLYLNLVL